MEELHNIFGKCFICLTNSPDNLNVGVSLHFLCEYLKLDLKGEKKHSDFADLSVPLCPNCEKSLEKFNSLCQSLEKVKMEMDYQFELVKNLICDNPVNGYNDFWKNVAQLRKQILPKCMERKCKNQPRVKIKRIPMSKINIKRDCNKKEDASKPSILQEAIVSIKLEEVDLVPEYFFNVFDDTNLLEEVDVDYGISTDSQLLTSMKVENGITSGVMTIMREKALEPLTKSDLKCGNSLGQRVSHPEKQYVCNICGNSYDIKGRLTRHVRRTHEGYREVCKVPGCNREFAGSGYLHEHMRKVHPHVSSAARRYGTLKDKYTKIKINGQSRLQCNWCKLSYKQLVHFKRHYDSAHGPPVRYECEGCGKSYSRKDYLTTHRKSCYVSK